MSSFYQTDFSDLIEMEKRRKSEARWKQISGDVGVALAQEHRRNALKPSPREEQALSSLDAIIATYGTGKK